MAPGLIAPAPVNAGLVILRLVPWEQRTVKQQDIVKELFGKVSNFPGARAFPINPGSLGQRGFQQQIQFVLGGPDYETLRDWRDRMLAQGAGDRALRQPRFRLQGEPAGSARPDRPRPRRRPRRLRSRTSAARSSSMFGERQVSTFASKGEEYYVIVRARAAGPGDAERPLEHLRARRRTATSCRCRPSSP